MNANFRFSSDGNVGIGSRAALLHAEHINISSDYDICGFRDNVVGVSSPNSFSGGCFEFGGFMRGDPLVLVPEGGICRVEPVRKKQRCISCGNMSWRDETITCPGCSSQVFENI